LDSSCKTAGVTLSACASQI